MWSQLTRTDDTVTALLLRLALGLVMFPHGAQKLLGWFGGRGFFGTIDLFHQIGFSTVVAILVTLGEFFGGLGLLVGFLTRVAAGGIGIIMLGAIFLVHWQFGFFMNWAGQPVREGFEYHILAMGLVAAIMILGGGKWSIDRALTEH